MNLINKLNRLISLIRLAYTKAIFKGQIQISRNFSWKNTSRINIWDKKGNIVVGDSFAMGHNSELYTWNGVVKIGVNTSMNDNCKIYGSVQIGSNCLLASNIFISSGRHSFSYMPPLPIKQQDKLLSVDEPVVIEDDCWIGFGVVIMPGVYVGKGAVIGSNAVVTKAVFPYTINAGIPCREISKRLDFAPSYSKLESNNPEHWPFFYRGCNYNQFDNIESLKKGIQIVDNVSIFLLPKTINNQLEISGWSNSAAEFKVFVNKESYMEATTESGYFDLKLNLINIPHIHCSTFDEISNELKNAFNIIVIEINKQNNNTLNEDYQWGVTSIGI